MGRLKQSSMISIQYAGCESSACFHFGGLPRPIRENCTLLCLFKLKDQNQLKKVHEEIGSDVNLEQFDKFFSYATSKPFGFLTVDFNAKTPEQTFRCCFNEYLS